MDDKKFRVFFDGKKYDLKCFLQDHPGGVNTLKHYEGKSVEEVMSKFEHSNNAYHILNDFEVDSGSVKDTNLTGEVSENYRIITKEEAGRDLKEIAELEELESRLDWSKPLLSQLHLIAPDYQKWVNCAVYRHIRIFRNPLLECLTYTPWYVVPIIWIPIILYFGVTQFFEKVLCDDACDGSPMSIPEFCLHIFCGMLLWTGLEYNLHRWVFHLDPGTTCIPLIQFHFLIHGMHHKIPFDGLRQVFPPVPAMVMAYLIYSPFKFFLPYPKIWLAGALAGYLTYDMIHYYSHHGSPRDGTYLYAMKRYHSNHHFINNDKAFGITNKIWDNVFKTVVQVKKLGFSLQW